NWTKIVSQLEEDRNGKTVVPFNTTVNIAGTGSNDGQHRESHCFEARDEVACFWRFNETHTEVNLNQLFYKDGTLDMELEHKQSYYARLVLALSPEDYVLVNGYRADMFCYLNLFQH